MRRRGAGHAPPHIFVTVVRRNLAFTFIAVLAVPDIQSYVFFVFNALQLVSFALCHLSISLLIHWLCKYHPD